jgi:drug/metabolite transporter (DMT)-like permease
MIYVFLSVCCSVFVSVLLKMARRYQIDVFQAITWNYSIAILLTWFFLKPQVSDLEQAPVYVYTLLGLLLPSLFVVIAAAVRYTGIVRTDVAQRLSLFIPLAASFLLFGETLNTLKVIGIILGFAAIICCIPWQKQQHNKGRQTSSNAWLFLLVVFVGMGVIDILFKQMAAFKGASFSGSLLIVYSLSFIIALIGLLYLVYAKKAKFQYRHIFFGWILGVANFGNILFYLKAHQALASNPSTVFTAMNIGVIAVGTLVGLFIFREKLSWLNKVGIAVAVAAIIIISIAK